MENVNDHCLFCVFSYEEIHGTCKGSPKGKAIKQTKGKEHQEGSVMVLNI